MRNFLISTASVVAFSLPAVAQDPLFTLESGNRSDGPILQEIPVMISQGVLRPGEEAELRLPLPTGDLIVKLQPVSPGELGLNDAQSAWQGVADDGITRVFLMLFTNGIQGQIEAPKLTYRLKAGEDGVGVLEVIDPSRLIDAPNDTSVEEGSRRERGGGEGGADSACADSQDRIDIVAFYTNQARNGAGGMPEIENEIAFAVGHTNLAYANSGVYHRLNLVGVFPTGFDEPPGGVTSMTLRDQLRNPSDMILDTVHGVRDAVHADLVTLIYETGDYCGYTYVEQEADADTTDDMPFSVVRRGCSTEKYSFAHETGHNIGAQHDRDSGALDPPAHDYNYGHVQLQPSMATVPPWRTVMAYPTLCEDNGIDILNCNRIGHFSNPGISYMGDPTGVPLSAAEPEHNVRIFEVSDAQVAKYRCANRIDPGPYVWMKDRWEDTGDEPDAATAGKAMWQSPYIWVRLGQDTTGEHEHEHQNPLEGQDAFVYVKTHNDGNSPETGELELYFASASTNLNNPANWTQIGSETLTLTAGVESTEFFWDLDDEVGHFCLLARWNTSGSALSFSDLGTFVRNSNDAVWRNVNIVPAGGGGGDTENRFVMRGDREFEETFLMIRADPLDARPVPWPEFLDLTLRIDPGLVGSPAVQIGVEEVDQGTYRLPIIGRTLVVGPVLLTEKDETEGVLDVRQDQVMAQKVAAGLAMPAWFDITISQVTKDALPLINLDEPKLFETPGLVLGGVTYQVRLAEKPGE